MKRTDKETFVTDFRERVQRAPVMYLTDFTGLSVKEMTQLRRQVKEVGGEYLVVKNRLAMRALAELDLPDVTEHLTGPTGVVLGYDEAVSVAKALSDYAKEHKDRPTFKVAVLDRNVLGPDQIERLARLPSREQLLAELAGAMQAPMASMVTALGGKLQETAGLLEALGQQKAG